MEDSRSLLALAVEIRQWLDADAVTPESQRLSRDRKIGENIPAQRDAERVLAWWTAVHAAPSGAGHRLVLLRRIANAILILLGLLLGAGVASVALGYQGDYPVNLFGLLGVLVGIPLVMLLVSLLMLAGGTPQTVRDAFSVLSPGRWAGGWLERQLSVQMFDSVSGRGVSVRFARWQLMVFSQLFTIGYFIGVLVVSAMLVVFTDLAFGWSSTIDISNDSVKQLVAFVSVPFQWIPAAVPEPALVDASRFFRLEGQLIEPDRAAQLGGWWPFVLVFTFSYGLLPRLVMTAIASWRLRAATIALLERGPQIQALLDRLDSPVVEFDADAHTTGRPTGAAVRALVELRPTPADTVISWNAVLDQDQLASLLNRWQLPADQGLSLAEWDTSTSRTATLARLPARQRIIVLTKGWDPPLLAFIDLVGDIQMRLDAAPAIVVVPLDTSLQQIKKEDANTWNLALSGTAAEVAGTIP